MLNEWDYIGAGALTLSIGFFAAYYGWRAPWWKSFEGRTLFGLMVSFLLIMLNLMFKLLFDWALYDEVFSWVFLAGTVFMVNQNVALIRAQRRARREAAEAHTHRSR